MKIGLVRHFKVDIEEPKDSLSSVEYGAWRDAYDKCDNIVPNQIDLKGIGWDICYTSSLIRAAKTARTVFKGEIIETDLLREVDMKYSQEIDDKRKVYDWDIYSMIQWAKNDDIVVETLRDTKKRANQLLNQLEENHDINDKVLLFSHGTMMLVIGEQLKKRGYEGDRVIGAVNGEVYVYSKSR